MRLANTRLRPVFSRAVQVRYGSTGLLKSTSTTVQSSFKGVPAQNSETADNIPCQDSIHILRHEHRR